MKESVPASVSVVPSTPDPSTYFIGRSHGDVGEAVGIGDGRGIRDVISRAATAGRWADHRRVWPYQVRPGAQRARGGISSRWTVRYARVGNRRWASPHPSVVPAATICRRILRRDWHVRPDLCAQSKAQKTYKCSYARLTNSRTEHDDSNRTSSSARTTPGAAAESRIAEPRRRQARRGDRMKSGDARPARRLRRRSRSGRTYRSRGLQAGLLPITGWNEDHPDGPREAAVVALISGTRAVPTGVTNIKRNGSSPRPDGLTDTDVGNLTEVLNHEIASNTMTNYRVQWRNFIGWARERGLQALPADPAHVAAYLAERMEASGHKPATLRVAASAIAFVHKAVGADDPCARSAVKRTLRSATRKAGRSQKQAQALTADVLAAIRATAHQPRRGRGGRLESAATARTRGNFDIALISLMRDAMLRVSEAAALTWSDLATEPDDTGRLLIRRSKTDVDGEGAAAFVSSQTMATLRLVRHGAADRDRVFGLRPNQIARRIKQAAQAAGCGEGFSGHSPRVGMARDLARAGIELPSLMNAGRWRSASMPARYTRNEVAGRGAVAQFHGIGNRRD